MKTQSQPQAGGEAAHTPTPWLLPTSNKGALPVYIAAKDDRYKSGMVLICAVGDLADGPHDYRETAANAAFIVKACNSHAQLTAENAALREGCQAAFDHLEGLRGRDNNPALWSRLRALLCGQPAQALEADPVKAALVEALEQLLPVVSEMVKDRVRKTQLAKTEKRLETINRDLKDLYARTSKARAAIGVMPPNDVGAAFDHGFSGVGVVGGNVA